MGFWTEAVWHLALPRACAHCRVDLAFRADEPLCPACAARLPAAPDPACLRCGGALGARRDFCAACTGRLFCCRLIRAACAHRGPAASLVHAFKFRGQRDAARLAGRVLAAQVRRRPELRGFDAVVAVPASPRRERERGYNQAEIIAREVAAAAGVALLDALERRRAAAPMWRLGREDRRARLAGAFAPRPQARVAGLKILLVDDVCATATTLEECARALRAAGAADARAAVFARAGAFISS